MASNTLGTTITSAVPCASCWSRSNSTPSTGIAISPPPIPNNPPSVPSTSPNRTFSTLSNGSITSISSQKSRCYAASAGTETHSHAQWLCVLGTIGNLMQTDALSEQFGLFLDVLDTGSFSAAARRHALTPSAIARRIDALERSFGVQLVSRSTHAIRPTTAGLAFAERARRIVHELHLARAEAAALDSTPTGRIRIDAPTPFGRRHLAPALAEFLQAYPGVDIQLRLIDSFVDLHGAHLGEVDL